MFTVYLGIVQTGLSFDVYGGSKPEGVTIAVPADGKEQAADRFGSLIFCLRPGYSRMTMYDYHHMHSTYTNKIVLDHAPGRTSWPWHVAAFSCRQNAEQWVQKTVAHYMEYYDLAEKSSDVYYDFISYQLAATKNITPEEAMKIAENEAWEGIWTGKNIVGIFSQALFKCVNDFTVCGWSHADDEEQRNQGLTKEAYQQFKLKRVLEKYPEFATLFDALCQGRRPHPPTYLRLIKTGLKPTEALTIAESC